MRVPLPQTFASALTIAALALAGCSPPPVVSVDNAYVRLPAVARGAAAGYFTLNGGAADATLLSVQSNVAIRAEMHESMKSGGMMAMKPLASVPLPAHGEVKFAPGGKHFILFDMNPGIKRGSKVPLLLTFADGLRVRTNAVAIAAGDPVPEE